MGSIIEVNDTLRISREQGFPGEILDLATHLDTPYQLDHVSGATFSFSAKPGIMVYKQPPVRNFLVEDVLGKWVYWGLCHILTVAHDYEKNVTSGTFRITHLNTPEEMRQAFWLVDRVADNDYFTS